MRCQAPLSSGNLLMAIGPDDLIGVLISALPDKVQIGCLVILLLMIGAAVAAYFLLPAG